LPKAKPFHQRLHPPKAHILTKNHTFVTQLTAMTELTKLNPTQLDILRLFNRPISDAELEEIRQLLAAHLLKRVRSAANQTWDEKGYTDAHLKELHERTPYQTGDAK
jgi:hypothetical protein